MTASDQVDDEGRRFTVIGAIVALLVLPLILARDFQPPKNTDAGHN